MGYLTVSIVEAGTTEITVPIQSTLVTPVGPSSTEVSMGLPRDIAALADSAAASALSAAASLALILQSNRGSYTHFQAIASTTWVVVHGLGKFPSVTVADSANSECEGFTTYDTLDQVTITFSAPFGGYAYLN